MGRLIFKIGPSTVGLPSNFIKYSLKTPAASLFDEHFQADFSPFDK